MIADWNDEGFKNDLKKAYLEAKPTHEANSEILRDLAELFDVSANAIRVFLVRENVYVKQTVEAVSTDNTEVTGTKRVPKEATINKLKKLIEEKGKPVDDAILDKLTGKAAQYIITLIS